MKRKTYGILSLNIYEADNNWGSVLQSWALQETLTRMGVDVKIINYKPDSIKKLNARYPILYKFPFHVKTLLREYKNDIRDWKDYIVRDDKFKRFIDENYVTTQYYNYRNMESLDLDGYIVGSDIVWHVPFWNGFDRGFFCDYESMKCKHNVAYAPSMADQHLSTEEELKFQKLLKNFKCISIRERSQISYVQKFTDKTVVPVLDPTLLLEREDYNRFLVRDLITDEYILLYTVAQDKKLIEYVQAYAKKRKLKIIRVKCQGTDLLDADWKTFNGAGIEEWITLIANANVIFTNSFHCCIFSILYSKKFFATYRDFGKYKIIDLLSSLGLKNYKNNNEAYDFDEDYDFDYNSVYEKLEKLREESKEYLKKSLDLEY